MMIDLIGLSIRTEGTCPTCGQRAGMQIGNDNAAAFSRDPGHLGDRLMRRRQVAQREGTDCEISGAIGQWNPAGIRQAETAVKSGLARRFHEHLWAKVHTEDLASALLG